jgi:hypothetical protein
LPDTSVDRADNEEDHGWNREDQHISACVGTVYAATVVVRAPSPEWRERAPYGLCLVDLDEGVRVMTHAEPRIGIGSRVRIGFQRTDRGMLPIAALLPSDEDRP